MIAGTAPVLMLQLSGITQAIMFPIIGFFAVYLRYRHVPRRILPKGWITLMLWIATLVMAVAMGYSVISQF